MNDCTFCQIVRRELPVHVIYEDENNLAFLDTHPRTPGATLVITKEHYPSYAFDVPDEIYTKSFLLAKRLGKVLDNALGSFRTFMVTEGMQIPHFHIKLYPYYKIVRNHQPEDFLHVQVTEYPGYITTLHGPRADDKELAELASKISKEASKL